MQAFPTNDSYQLTDPTIMPKATGFLWNNRMMIQLSCRGYAVSQFMQPEPAKYSHGPTLEAKTFMQPEQPYFAHHPGRFLYVKDEESGELFSAPFEPVRKADDFVFTVGTHSIAWRVRCLELEVEMALSLPVDEPIELWRVNVRNLSGRARKISVYPSFTVGYMSWMNQSGAYHADLQGIVCSSITPYQKYQEYEKIKTLRDQTFLLSDCAPCAWEVSQEAFEGEGGIASPSQITGQDTLSSGDSNYEMPTCALQYRLALGAGEAFGCRLLFGAATDAQQIADIRGRYFAAGGFEAAERAYADYVEQGRGCIRVKTPDSAFDNMVNCWLPRQMYYHGVTNRLSTDPQTRNYLQDNMGMSYIQPALTRQAFLTALAQQKASGAMPDGIILHPDAQLKYINQVPHSDHCVWLPVCLRAYLDETNDYALLNETVPFEGGGESATVFEHISRAMDWLISDRDERGLSFIKQGDWCDPMNMVGYKGKGVSGWLTIACAYAFTLWADLCEEVERSDRAAYYRAQAAQTNEAANRHFWDGQWYARGITDDGVLFGVQTDKEGRIYLNPQGWAILSGAANAQQKQKILTSVTEQLETPFGVEMLAPAYTQMREDVGRLTQKYPGTAENGAVYNHAAVFYIYALYTAGEYENAYRLIQKMIPGPDKADMLRRGQLPVFIPNYYRGAYRQIERTAGRSSHLFNTGTIQWLYRCLIDGLFGLRGCREGLSVRPQLPSSWREASVCRSFRGARLDIDMARCDVTATEVYLDGAPVQDGILRNLQAGGQYRVTVKLPG